MLNVEKEVFGGYSPRMDARGQREITQIKKFDARNPWEASDAHMQKFITQLEQTAYVVGLRVMPQYSINCAFA